MVATDVYDSRWVPVLVSAIEIPTFYVNSEYTFWMCNRSLFIEHLPAHAISSMS